MISDYTRSQSSQLLVATARAHRATAAELRRSAEALERRAGEIEAYLVAERGQQPTEPQRRHDSDR